MKYLTKRVGYSNSEEPGWFYSDYYNDTIVQVYNSSLSRAYNKYPQELFINESYEYPERTSFVSITNSKKTITNKYRQELLLVRYGYIPFLIELGYSYYNAEYMALV